MVSGNNAGLYAGNFNAFRRFKSVLNVFSTVFNVFLKPPVLNVAFNIIYAHCVRLKLV